MSTFVAAGDVFLATSKLIFMVLHQLLHLNQNIPPLYVPALKLGPLKVRSGSVTWASLIGEAVKILNSPALNH